MHSLTIGHVHHFGYFAKYIVKTCFCSVDVAPEIVEHSVVIIEGVRIQDESYSHALLVELVTNARRHIAQHARALTYLLQMIILLVDKRLENKLEAFAAQKTS